MCLFTVFGLALQQYYVRHNGRPLTYDDAWYFENSLDFDPDTPLPAALRKAVERIEHLDARFIIRVEGFAENELQGFLNRLHGEIRGMLDRGELRFRRCAEIELPRGLKVVLYQRSSHFLL